MPERNAGWLSNSEARLFARVLEPAPAPNRRGASGFRALSFYTSELKAASAIHSKLNLIANGQITTANEEGRTFRRYRNTLLNLGLIEDEGLALTTLGESVRNLTLPPDVPQRAILIDGTIFRGLSEILRQTPQGDDAPRAPAFFAQLVLNARDFFDSIPAAERVPTVVDENLLLLLQIIYSHGPEVGRFWDLGAPNRALALAAFSRAYRARPAQMPSGSSRSFYRYTESLAENIVQADIRHRVAGMLSAYLDLEVNNPAELQELIGAAEVVLGLVPATPAARPAGRPVTTPAPALEEVPAVEPEGTPEEPPLPPVQPAEVTTELPITQRRDARVIRISGRDAAKRRFSKRAGEYGRWAEDSVVQALRDRERRGEISALTWRSDIGETPGWDIDYVEVATGRLKRIEVKGTKLASVDVIDLTANEMTKLREHGPDYALALVTRCAHVTWSPKVHFLWDPAGYFEQRSIVPQAAIWTVRLSDG